MNLKWEKSKSGFEKLKRFLSSCKCHRSTFARGKIASFALSNIQIVIKIIIIFSCPEQLNRWPCPLVGCLLGLLPLTIRVFTTLQSDPAMFFVSCYFRPDRPNIQFPIIKCPDIQVSHLFCILPQYSDCPIFALFSLSSRHPSKSNLPLIFQDPWLLSQDCSVVGLGDSQTDQRVAAVVVINPNKKTNMEDLLKWCNENMEEAEVIKDYQKCTLPTWSGQNNWQKWTLLSLLRKWENVELFRCPPCSSWWVRLARTGRATWPSWSSPSSFPRRSSSASMTRKCELPKKLGEHVVKLKILSA